jgi:hypothetical protein
MSVTAGEKKVKESGAAFVANNTMQPNLSTVIEDTLRHETVLASETSRQEPIA